MKELKHLDIPQCVQDPSLLSNIRVLALTTYNEISFITNIMKCGASGYLLKNTSGAELITAIKAAYSGEQYLSKEVKEKLISSSFGKGRNQGVQYRLSA